MQSATTEMYVSRFMKVTTPSTWHDVSVWCDQNVYGSYADKSAVRAAIWAKLGN